MIEAIENLFDYSWLDFDNKDVDEMKAIAAEKVPLSLARNFAALMDSEQITPENGVNLPQSWPYRLKCLLNYAEGREWAESTADMAMAFFFDPKLKPEDVNLLLNRFYLNALRLLCVASLSFADE